MTLAIRQTAQPADSLRWKWSAWIDGSAEELAEIESVAWLLHPTFPEPVKIRSDPATNFRLDATGWGVFTLRAKVSLRTGAELTLEHDLVFGDPASSDPQKEPTVFISHASADKPTAATLRQLLEDRGMQVLDAAESLSAGAPFKEQVEALIERSDALVALVSPHSSAWLTSEALAAKDAGVPVLPVLTEGRMELPDGLRDLQTVPGGNLAASADSIRETTFRVLANKRNL